MNERLTTSLIVKYPKLFQQPFYFEHNSGWYWIIERLASYLDFQMKHNKMPKVVAEQVKEKFGTLRFYYSGGNELTRGAVNFAEYLSGIVCEYCGQIPAETQDFRGWLHTLCSLCSQQKQLTDLR